MFHLPMLEQVGRIALPTGLLKILLTAARAGSDQFEIVLCDHLAPAYGSNDQYIPWGGSISEALNAVLNHCPPAKVKFPVVSMAPDKRDWESCPPEKINKQWHKLVHSFRDWSGAAFDPIARTDFYQKLPMAAVVVHTRSTEPYGNLLLTVDPSSSKTLNWIPKEIQPDLAELISVAGHSHGILLGSKRMLSQIKLPPRIGRFNTDLTVRKFLAVLSTVWLPDEHDQPPAAAAKRALAYFGNAEERKVDEICSELTGNWREPGFRQRLTTEGLDTEVMDRRNIAVVIAEDDGSDFLWIMKNWISGHNGGF